MREIKFRVWDGKKMYEASQIRLDTGAVSRRTGTTTHVRVSNPVLMQYTGLKDNDNQEIYEGDVLERIYYFKPLKKKENGERKIIERRARVVKYTQNSQFCGFNISTRSSNNSRVIGNIYEHKHLLEANQ